MGGFQLTAGSASRLDPASMAVLSVSLMRGRTAAKVPMRGSEIAFRRKGGIPNSAAKFGE